MPFKTRLLVSAQTYDISDRQNPALAGEIQADGYYETARLTGGVLYLMTTYAPENAVNPVLYRSYDVTTATADGSSGRTHAIRILLMTRPPSWLPGRFRK